MLHIEGLMGWLETCARVPLDFFWLSGPFPSDIRPGRLFNAWLFNTRLFNAWLFNTRLFNDRR